MTIDSAVTAPLKTDYNATDGVHDLNVEASTVGLAPGVWPSTLVIEGRRFRKGVAMGAGDSFAGFEYYPVAADYPLRVRVWND